MMDAIVSLAPRPGLTAGACAAMNVSRASVYRQRAGLVRPRVVRRPRPSPRRALAVVERQAVLDLLRAPRFADQAPAEVYASLLDEGVYHCSIRTMYRILAANQEVRERRDQLRHPAYQKPELLAQAPNQVWSWDITKFMGPAKWTYFYLCVIIDIFSRRVVGWAFFEIKKDAAPGVDGLTWHDYEADLDRNIESLHDRVHRGAYRAQPSRRLYIPKPDGRQRPIAIAALEDKIVQRATAAVLNTIYEEDFLGFSYGFRPKRSQNDALDALEIGRAHV